MADDEVSEQLAFLRQQFPGWYFSWHEAQPQWHAQRIGFDYHTVPAAITGVSASDPNELALALVRVTLTEPRVEPETEEAAGLAALRECLALRGFEVELDETGLTVIAPVDDRGFRLTAQVICKPRPNDDGRLWFWSQAGPLAEADRIIDAVLAIVALLRPSS